MANQEREKWRVTPQSEKTKEDLLFIYAMTNTSFAPIVDETKEVGILKEDPLLAKLRLTAKVVDGPDFQGKRIAPGSQVADAIKRSQQNSK